MEDDRKARLVRITGRVQGVGFRFWTRGQAQRLGLTGWVRNEADGSVTALIAGPAPAVDLMLERLWAGPAGASVSGVFADIAAPGEAPAEFRIAK